MSGSEKLFSSVLNICVANSSILTKRIQIDFY